MFFPANYEPKLFLSEENLYRYTRKIEIFPDFIFQVPFIRVLHILRKITEKSKGRSMRWQLGHVFDLYEFALECRRRGILNRLQHDFVKARCGDPLDAVAVYLHGQFKNPVQALFVNGRNENNRNIGKRCYFFTDYRFHSLG